jgi:hypothetical protein
MDESLTIPVCIKAQKESVTLGGDLNQSSLCSGGLRMKGFKLGAPFEILGHWWLPDAPDQRLAGKLTSQRGHLELKLLGRFNSIDINARNLVVPVIHGIGDAKEFTLWRAVQETASFHFPGGFEQTFNKLRVLIGGHFDRESETKFSAVGFDAPQIGPWMGCEPVVENLSELNELDIPNMSYKMASDRTKVFGPTSTGITYRFGSSVSTRREPYLAYGFDTTPSVHIDFAEPQTCSQAIDRVEKITDLLMLLVGENVDPQAITLHLPDEKWGFDFLCEFPPPVEKKLIDRREILAPLNKLGDSFIHILEKWDEERTRIGDTVALLGDVLDRNAPASHVRMLLLAQALEAFHRNVIGGEYLTKPAYEPFLQALLNAIPDGIKGDHRSSLKSRLRYGNELSLRTRLKKLLESISDDAMNNLQIDRRSFVCDVVDARNDFTHWVQEREEDRPNGAHLANLLSSLLALTQLITLKHLGVDESLVVARMLESPWRYARRFQPIV